MTLDVRFQRDQLTIIEADPSARVYVDAGPGTGKTAVAIARVAWLVQEGGLDPGAIWLVSFTRTAVQEMRERIARELDDEAIAGGLRISTLDSMAWQIRSGFDRDATPPASYEQGIDRLVDLLATNQDAAEFLGQLRHLVVDEAQDVVGSRAIMVLEIIHSLPRSAGVTVMADEAQAIYGFADEDVTTDSEGTDLPTVLREYMSEDFTEVQLTEIHRTNDPKLVALLVEGRTAIRDGAHDVASQYESVRHLVIRSSHSPATPPKDLKAEGSAVEGAFLLFRRRGDALQAANHLDLLPRRLRLSGLPAAVHSWIGEILWDWIEPEFGETEFRERWVGRVRDSTDRCDEAWSLLLRLAGASKATVSMRRLARMVARPLPPLELASPDFGTSGPILGTIHASKGREADVVWVYLPPHPEEDGDERSRLEEEARVLFVAASRARTQLRVGEQSAATLGRTLDGSGRAYTTRWSRGSPAASVEVGRQGDIRISGLVGRDYFTEAFDARHAQESVRGMGSSVVKCSAIRGPAPDFHYSLTAGGDDGPVVAFLDQQVNSDLFKVGKHVRRMRPSLRGYPSSTMRYLPSLGTRTISVDPDDSIRETLHSPWSESGFALAPMLCAYPVVYYR